MEVANNQWEVIVESMRTKDLMIIFGCGVCMEYFSVDVNDVTYGMPDSDYGTANRAWRTVIVKCLDGIYKYEARPEALGNLGQIMELVHHLRIDKNMEI